MALEVTLRPWSADDLPVLDLTNAPEMTTRLGGPETPGKVRDRHELDGEQDFQYRKGHPIRANTWRYRLSRLR